MFVVTVDFVIRAEHTDAFRGAVLTQARSSTENETGCVQFDVCIDPTEPRRIFLYEVYADTDAFATHLDSAHFKSFDAAIRDWVDSKDVRTFQRAHP